MALDLWLEAHLVEHPGGPVLRGTLAALDPHADIVGNILRSAGLPEAFHLEMHSDIPVGRGLGASAAATVAGIALADAGRGGHLQRAAVFRNAAEREGHPDNAAPAVFGGAVLAADPSSWSGDVQTEGNKPAALSVHPEIAVALAVPDIEIKTTDARALLPESVASAIAVEQARRAGALVAGLARADGDLIRWGMDDVVAVPHRKALIPGYDAAVAAAVEAGAYGATISGSGSTLIALTLRGTEAAVADALATALTDNGAPAYALTPRISRRGLIITDPSSSGEGEALDLHPRTER
jgi:homoserine kinase